ncbi:MAG: hypothetical protein PHV82_15520 [Victivallaceae bacterium]|nr:hypothetical protein [Victivallaceae bacterium]
MKKTKFTLTIIFTLLTGVITGSLATYLIVRAASPKLSFSQRHAARIESIIKELALNEQQQKQFYTIHLRHLSQNYARLRETKPFMLQQIDEETKAISLILSPEQREKYEKIMKEKRDKFKTKFANFELLKKHFPRQ